MSATALVAPQAGDTWRLQGVLDFDAVADVWPRLDALIGQRPDLDLSLADVSRTNSAGLVLLLEARDAARRRGCRLQFLDVPQDLLDLARMTGCEALVVGAAG